MTSSLKAEFRKLLSVRSTYFIVIIALAMVVLFAGYGSGYHIQPGDLHNPTILANQSANALLFGGIVLALVGLLITAHEYRYNTILYTLTSSNSRTKSLLAKLTVVTIFAVVLSAVMALFSPLCSIIGVHLVGKHLVPQVFPVWHVIWQCVFLGWGYSMYAFILTAIIRSQVGATVTFLLIPLIGEHILMGIFKSIGKYLPFNNLQSVVNSLLLKGDTTTISTAHSITVSLIYVVVGLIACFILFARRDAN